MILTFLFSLSISTSISDNLGFSAHGSTLVLMEISSLWFLIFLVVYVTPPRHYITPLHFSYSERCRKIDLFMYHIRHNFVRVWMVGGLSRNGVAGG